MKTTVNSSEDESRNRRMQEEKTRSDRQMKGSMWQQQHETLEMSGMWAQTDPDRHRIHVSLVLSHVRSSLAYSSSGAAQGLQWRDHHSSRFRSVAYYRAPCRVSLHHVISAITCPCSRAVNNSGAAQALNSIVCAHVCMAS